MIKIIEDPVSTFSMKCPCGCKFTYQLEDLSSWRSSIMYILCPRCGWTCLHENRIKEPIDEYKITTATN